ncbi:hypothetical protein ANN_05977, partial [Periplaneta americana]
RPVQDERSADVIAAVLVNPHDSTRRIARESGISQTTVWRVLNGSKYHPYHISMHQQLEGEDFQSLVVFSSWLSEKWTTSIGGVSMSGIFGLRIIGRYFFEGALKNILSQLLEDEILVTRAVMWLQQDGCLA